MNRELRLTVELVPKTSWYNNMRKIVPPPEWDKIRRRTYAEYGNRCGVCDSKGRLNCHEIWHYDDHRHVQELKGFIALCDLCPIRWRQGIKHDAASVMELDHDNSGGLRNKLGENVDVESEHVYPLLKSSDLFHRAKPQKYVIVTQKTLNESTNQLRWTAPRLWDYLITHTEVFERRKSSIYRNKPTFSMFGVGDYSFSLYKVGVSGLHKTPKFRAIGPVKGRPVMLDDTCYFVSCYSPEQAILLSSLLNDPMCLELIRSMTFLDSKRPITKKLLQRVDLLALLERADRHSLLSRAGANLENLITAEEWQETVGSVPLEKILLKEAPYSNYSSQIEFDL